MITRNEVRLLWDKSGLTYQKVLKSKYIEDLANMLNYEFTLYNAPPKIKPVYFTHVNRKSLKIKWNEHSQMTTCFIDGTGSYFDKREIISFNQDGFIGLAGGADKENVQPILKAFVKWIEYLSKNEITKTEE